MSNLCRRAAWLLPLLLLFPVLGEAPPAADPLPSWNEGPARRSIVKFVRAVTDKKGPHYVPPAQRIAVFDNDGTLWTEKPVYTQVFFAFDRVRDLGAKRPEWKNRQPFKGILNREKGLLSRLSKKDLLDVMMATHAGLTTEEFEKVVKDWLARARHPDSRRPYTEMVYKPMLELLAYLRANGFKTFIASGGTTEFMRVFSEEVYGIPPEQVIGSTVKMKWEMRKTGPVLVRLPEVTLLDRAQKPVGIQQHIGRRPIAAFGNSDGDLEMLQWTAAGTGARLMLLVRHDDEKREYRYDRESLVGRLDKALDEAKKRGWTVVSMKKDWKRIFAFEGR